MTTSALLRTITREGRPVRAVITESEATLVLEALGVAFEVGLARERGELNAGWALTITIGGAVVGGALGAWVLGGPAGLLLGALLGGAVAARSIQYRLTVSLLEGGGVQLRGHPQ